MEAKNKLYRKSYHRKVILKDGTELPYSSYGYHIQYGVISSDNIVSDNWSDLLYELNYIEEFKGKTDRKGRLYCDVEYYGKHSSWKRARVYKDSFDRLEVNYKYQEFTNCDLRMSQILKELNIDEFILFLKDNDIAHLPNLR